MRLARRARSLAAWIACWAVLLAALAPTLSHALGSAPGFEVCSAGGMTSAGDEAGSPSGSPSKAAHLFEHCPYCSLHLPAAGVPPAAPVLALRADLAFAAPTAHAAVEPAAHGWLRQQPRAPPRVA